VVEARCHCGVVRLVMTEPPSMLNDCQCGHCRKRGVLWAYYQKADVEVVGATASYLWGDRDIAFHFCSQCGCTTHWSPVDPAGQRMAINGRLLEPEVFAAATVRVSAGP